MLTQRRDVKYMRWTETQPLGPLGPNVRHVRESSGAYPHRWSEKNTTWGSGVKNAGDEGGDFDGSRNRR